MAPGKRISSRIIANYSHLLAPSTNNNVQSTLKNDALHVVSTTNNDTLMYNYLHVSIKGDLSTREASPTADNLGLPHQSTPVNEANITVSSAKKKRGPNRGVALEEFYRTKGKISILIPDGLNRPVGEHHSKLSREAGIIIRNFAPMQVERWDQISDADKEILLKKLMITGIGISIEIIKNKMAPALKKVDLEIEFGRGFRSEAEILAMALDHGIIIRKGGGYWIKRKFFKHKQEVECFLAENSDVTEELVNWLKNQLFEKEQKMGESAEHFSCS
ncbi:hypothetical protein M5K25_013067 [Dendrobium thyrsiflorum]|uniref:Uncharacterized protein n=1 Tax=Dendrobium thyrsiflorum TaxID=117978 RepID=A0ABD0UYQ7_DENTH